MNESNLEDELNKSKDNIKELLEDIIKSGDNFKEFLRAFIQLKKNL